MDDVLGVGEWDILVGGALLLLIIVVHQDGLAEFFTHALRPIFLRLHLIARARDDAPLRPLAPEPVPPAALTVADLTVRFGGVVAVDDVSFDVQPGEVVGLIGPNGAGKTTIIDAVTGFVKPAQAQMSLGDSPITRWSPAKRARSGLRRSFQSLELFDDVSVEENIRAGADAPTPASWLTDLFWPGRHDLPSTAVSAIHEFELEPHLHQNPDELPYGRRRLVGIARAVASGPSVIMLDEPAAGLDETESRELASLIRRLADERRMAVLLVEHDVDLVMNTCDRIVVINFGRVIAEGTPADVRANPAVRDAYLGSGDDDEELATMTAHADDPAVRT